MEERAKAFANDLTFNRYDRGQYGNRYDAYIAIATEQDVISRANERERCINVAIEWLRKNVRPYYKFSTEELRKVIEGCNDEG